MAVFASQRLQASPVLSKTRRRPFLYFGLPFMTILVFGSFALSSVTRTRYDLRESKIQTLSKEDELKMNKARKKVDIREEYFKLRAKEGDLDNWENKRISRLPGQAEWGLPPAENGKS
jgi:cytochrome c oxidase assembly protein subunit 16